MTQAFIIATALFSASAAYFLLAARKREKEIIGRIDAKTPPDAGTFTDYEKVLASGRLSGFRKMLAGWLLAEFYREHRKETGGFTEKALARYSDLTGEEEYKQIAEDAYFNMANIYLFDFSDFRKAKEHYAMLLRAMPETRWLRVCQERIYIIDQGEGNERQLGRYFAGENLFSKGRFSEAISEFESIPAEVPDSGLVASALYFMGDIYNFKFNDFANAIAKYKAVVKQCPGFRYVSNCKFKIGECMRRMNRWEESIGEFREFIGAFSSNQYCDYAQYFIGDAYEHAGDPVNARIAYNLLLGNYPASMWVEMAKMKLLAIESGREPVLPGNNTVVLQSAAGK